MVKIINMEDEGHAAVASKCGLWWLTFLIERFKDCGNLGHLGAQTSWTADVFFPVKPFEKQDPFSPVCHTRNKKPYRIGHPMRIMFLLCRCKHM